MSFCGICGKEYANAEEQFAHMKEHTHEEMLNYENEQRKRFEEMKIDDSEETNHKAKKKKT